MYVVFPEELEDATKVGSNIVPSLEQAFAKIACRCGVNYNFEQEQVGWKLVLTDVERPECSPDPIVATCIKSRDAKRDLMSKAVDGRIRGHIAIAADVFAKTRIMRNAKGTRSHVA